jgi:hypothetical protein
MISIKSNPKYIKKIQKWNSVLDRIVDPISKKEFKKHIDRVGELSDLLDKSTMKLANSDRNIIFGTHVELRKELQQVIKWLETKSFEESQKLR